MRAAAGAAWDVVVAGGGFAGLAAAESAARAGLRVLVLERRRDLRVGVHTTGLLTPDAAAAVSAPAGTVGTRLDALDLRAATTRGPAPVRLAREGAGFVPTRTGALLEALAARAALAGAHVRTGSAARGVRVERGGACRVATAHGVEAARWVVAADGARSAIAASAGLPRPSRVLVGLERHVVPVRLGEVAADACTLVMDRRLAPGYAAWLVPGADGAWQVGLLGRPGGRWAPAPALDALLAMLRERAGFEAGPAHETRGGLVPVGGALAPVAGPVVPCGDAAGHVSALTAGGIGRAVLAGADLGAALARGEDAVRRAQARSRRGCGGARLALRAALEWGGLLLPARAQVAAAGLPLVRQGLVDLAFDPSDLSRPETAPAPT